MRFPERAWACAHINARCTGGTWATSELRGMFLLLSRYLKPLDEVDRVLAEHRVFLEKYYGRGLFIVSGPMQPRVGGVILTADAPRETIEAALAEDPFVREGVSAYEIIEFSATKKSRALAQALGK